MILYKYIFTVNKAYNTILIYNGYIMLMPIYADLKHTFSKIEMSGQIMRLYCKMMSATTYRGQHWYQKH